MTESAIKMERRCGVCRGTGVVEDFHCRLCGQRIADVDAWWSSDENALPCGHSEENLIEVSACLECAGTGRVERWLSPAEARAIHRGRMARVVFVGLAFITLAAVLLGVFLTSQGVEPICGYWWYIVPPLLYTTHRFIQS